MILVAMPLGFDAVGFEHVRGIRVEDAAGHYGVKWWTLWFLCGHTRRVARPRSKESRRGLHVIRCRRASCRRPGSGAIPSGGTR